MVYVFHEFGMFVTSFDIKQVQTFMHVSCSLIGVFFMSCAVEMTIVGIGLQGKLPQNVPCAHSLSQQWLLSCIDFLLFVSN